MMKRDEGEEAACKDDRLQHNNNNNNTFNINDNNDNNCNILMLILQQLKGRLCCV